MADLPIEEALIDDPSMAGATASRRRFLLQPSFLFELL
jgi:hypothetical protein